MTKSWIRICFGFHYDYAVQNWLAMAVYPVLAFRKWSCGSIIADLTDDGYERSAENDNP